MASVHHDPLLSEEVMHDHLAGDVSDLTATLDPRYVIKLDSGSLEDMGLVQDSSPDGITGDYITDKLLANIAIGNSSDITGASATRLPIRATASTLQIYADGAWQTIVSNFVFRENSTYGYALEHKPIGFTFYLDLMTGSSLNNLGLNGLPLVQGYTVSMGAYPVAQISGGRTII